MILQDLDKSISTISQFLSFCDRIERANDFNKTDSKSRQPKKAKEHHTKKPRCSDKVPRECSRMSGLHIKYYSCHGQCNHTSEECETLNRKKKYSRGYAKSSDSLKKKSFSSQRKFQAMVNKSVKHSFATQQPLKVRNVSTINDEMDAAISKASISNASEENNSKSSKSQLESNSSSSLASSSSDK